MKGKYLSLVIWIFSFAIFVPTSSAQDSIYARNVIEQLSSPSFHGRGYAFKGDSIAANFISNEFKRFNLTSWERDYFQFYTISINVFEGNTLINFGKNYPSSFPSDALQIVAYSSSAKGNFKIIPATDKMLNDNLNPSKVKDKFITVDMMRYAADKGKKDQWDHIVRTNSLGAKGYILLNEKLSPYSPGIGRIKSSHTTISLLKDSIRGSLKNISIDLDANFIEQYQSRNVCGYIEGKLHPDTFFVIGAHYDHLGQIGTDYLFPGANDNASGVAMLLDLAHYFTSPENRPDYSIAFIAFGSEEIGLLGSFYFVENSPIPLENIKMMLNLDLVGTGENGFTFVGGQTFTDEFDKFVNINREKNHVATLIPREAAPNSDHYPFYKSGSKAMFIYGMGKSGKYHHPSDTLENLSLGGYTNLFRMIVDYINLHNNQ